MKCFLYPIADGGDHTLDVLLYQKQMELNYTTVTSPDKRKIQARYGFSKIENTAFIEMADASGMRVLSFKGNPLVYDSFGTGELILDALKQGAKKIIIGLGGSATVDGGLGMMRALGLTFIDTKNEPIIYPYQLKKLQKITIPNDIEHKLNETKIQFLTDVNNPLLGELGAAQIFGPQKGAECHDIPILEAGLNAINQWILTQTGFQVKDISGMGAAGGIATLPYALFGATLSMGADFILKQMNLEEIIKDMDLVITGEGQLDTQTNFGKAPGAIAQLAQKHSIPVIGIAGSVVNTQIPYFDAVYSIQKEPSTLIYSLNHAEDLVTNLSIQLANTLKLAQQITLKKEKILSNI